MFFIWLNDKKSLRNFIEFMDKFSRTKEMKSKIRFDSNFSRESVYFLDVKVNLREGKIKTSVYSKPTDHYKERYRLALPQLGHPRLILCTLQRRSNDGPRFLGWLYRTVRTDIERLGGRITEYNPVVKDFA